MHDQRAIRLVWVSHTGIILRNDSDALDDGRHGHVHGIIRGGFVSCPPARALASLQDRSAAEYTCVYK